MKNNNYAINPTTQIYDSLITAYNHFNEELFAGKLPPVMILLQRKAKTMGYASSNRWQNGSGIQVDELAVNPEYFLGYPILEIWQTLCHEQCHIYQYRYGTPSRRSYHNKEWADHMESIGLIPSSTGAPGGRKTGQSISDYALENGLFYKAALKLFYRGHALPWLDRRPIPTGLARWAVYDINNNMVDYRGRADRLLVTPLGKGADDDFVPTAVNLSSADIQQILSSPLQASSDGSIMADLTNDDQMVAPELLYGYGELIKSEMPEKKPTRMKYTCGCLNNVWGRPGLEITCKSCSCDFTCSST